MDDNNNHKQRAKNIEKEIIGMLLFAKEKDQLEITQDNMAYLRDLANLSGFEGIHIYSNKKGSMMSPGSLNVCIDKDTHTVIRVTAG